MIDVLELMETLQKADIVLVAEGSALRVEAPSGVLTDEMVDVVRESKAELLEVLAIDAALDSALVAKSDEEFRASLASLDSVLVAEQLIATGRALGAVAQVEDGVLVVRFEPVCLRPRRHR